MFIWTAEYVTLGSDQKIFVVNMLKNLTDKGRLRCRGFQGRPRGWQGDGGQGHQGGTRRVEDKCNCVAKSQVDSFQVTKQIRPDWNLNVLFTLSIAGYSFLCSQAKHSP